jgi:hypothetical protein
MPSSQTTIEDNNFDETYTVAEKDTADSTNQAFTNAKYAQIPTNTSPTTIRTTSQQADNDTFDIYFATRLGYGQKVGSYDGGVIVSIEASLLPVIPTATWVKSTTTILGDSATNITIDKDANMIPVVNQNSDNSSTADTEWANYDNAKWANAVTLKNDTDKYATDGSTTTPTLTPLEYFRDYAPIGTAIPEADILGYWVYIPRYAYEVQRRDAVDAVVAKQTDFNIMFEKSATPKKSPAPTCSILGSGYSVDSDDGAVIKDYSGYATSSTANDCVISKTYPTSAPYDESTWATHPAFTFGSTELNGIWIGKYETGTDIYCATKSATNPISCGDNIAPDDIYVKPNKAPIVIKNLGAMFTMTKNMSSNATSITGGNVVTNNTSTNTMNLTENSIAKMLKNSDWGSVAYLSTSKYGATGQGNAKVYNNGYYDSTVTANSDTKYAYKTGCGPVSSQSDAGGATCNSYETELGRQASTTGNVYGIYDMAGGVSEYVMGNRTTSSSQTTGSTSNSSSNYFEVQITDSAYYDAYRTRSAGGDTTLNRFGMQPTGSNSSENTYNNDVCTFETCGGQALHETKTKQPVATTLGNSWNGASSYFAYSVYPWTMRGSSANSTYAGIFASSANAGNPFSTIGFRSSLVILAE